MTAIKTSITVDEPIWEQIKDVRNRSHLINQALKLYLDREEMLRKAEVDYWKNVYRSLKQKDGEYQYLNPNGEELTSELFEKHLWNSEV